MVSTLKIILMSATIDPKTYIEYFPEMRKEQCLNVEGRMFKVELKYLEELTAEVGDRSVNWGDFEPSAENADFSYS